MGRTPFLNDVPTCIAHTAVLLSVVGYTGGTCLFLGFFDRHRQFSLSHSGYLDYSQLIPASRTASIEFEEDIQQRKELLSTPLSPLRPLNPLNQEQNEQLHGES